MGRLRPYRRFYLAGAVALLGVNLLDTFSPQIVRWAIDHLVQAAAAPDDSVAGSPLTRVLPADWFGPESFMGGMWVYGAFFVSIVALMGVFRYFMSTGFATGGVSLTHDLRRRLFSHVQRLSALYHDRTKAGDLMTLATSDINALREFYWIGIMIGLDTIYYFLLVPIYMAQISVPLMLAGLCTLPLIPFIVARLAGRIESRYDAMQAQLEVMSERARESFAGAKVVKSFAREDGEIRAFARMGREYKRRALRLAAVEALEQPLLILMLALADLVVIGYGGVLVLRGIETQQDLAALGLGDAAIREAVRAAGGITVGDFVAYFSYLLRLSGPMVGFGWVVSLYLRGKVSSDRIERVLQTEPEIVDAHQSFVPKRIRGEVEFRDLTFAYPAHRAADAPDARLGALSRVSLKIPAGKTVALVGAVGSGKSTLLNLIPRLYDPPPGTVFIDGHDVCAIPLSILRTQVGAVPQDTFLFSETILENVGVGAESTSVAELETPLPGGKEAWLRECARIAHLEEDVAGFPRGYETLLGEKGVNLSGGQRQRVAIARAIARRPAILLLDDCLSAVDTQTEERLLSGLQGVMRGRTTLIVSHRLSTVEHADEIVVLDSGRIAERGTHAELLRVEGLYAALWEKQQLEREVEESR
jgi:ATP-binding cassette subfamily B multidrug efflux pump